jgi:hypothetical protein
MVFDMALGLGAKRGSIEASAPFSVPTDGSEVPWTPEVEAAVWDGVALELELLFRGDQWSGWELSGQVTLGTGFRDRFAHALLAQWEHDEADGDDLALLYVPGARFSPIWSAIALVGIRQPLGRQREADTELIVIATVFADVGTFTLGLELDSKHSLRREETLALVPQVHYDFGERLALQLGLRVAMEKDVPRTELVFRIGSSW